MTADNHSELKRKPGRPEGGSDTRDVLLNSARNLFIERGYKKVTTRAIAEHAGTNIAMIHYYFGSKEQLYIAVLDETIKLIDDLIVEHMNNPHADSMRDIITRHYIVMSEFPEFINLMRYLQQNSMETGHDFYLDTVKNRLLPHFKTLLDNMVEKGYISQQTDTNKLCLIILSVFSQPFSVQPLFGGEIGMENSLQYYTGLGEFVADFVEKAIAPDEA
ncbi:TetR/AcrR family transcriptional regulator [Motilimonas pumila]|uniref:TetR/AcrR family transcriptional regulator n=1 Tax=Motilimonas pumila TaxID=2303987 RepID=A0A418YEI5_9GAMM|nr:TetR/AcrR family transcriptional regulator [Motilimonas pumila]RJG47570.1 TetR/AcrR family transcriptional regulator [Motilimonas pumila]